uniref:Uncharacterized protein n=1 Tax=viral metagenome TaxID=1070528 RepID=A0A6M3LJM0_9ZZZZ
MIDEVWVKGIQKIANARIKKTYPLMSEKHFSEADAKILLESYLMLKEEWYEFQRSQQSDNRDNEPRRGKRLRKVSKK